MSTGYEETTAANYTDRLRQLCVAVKLSKKQLGVTKTLSKEQKEKAAEQFGADGKRISASKKIIDTTNEKYTAVKAIFKEVTDEFKNRTLPYPEDQVRLMKHEFVADWDSFVSSKRAALDQAVSALEASYYSVKEEAQESLKDLFTLSDYPSSLEGLFSISVEYPAIQPDPMLADIKQGLYEREQQRIAARFDEALEMAETAFTSEFQGLIQHLCDRLTGLNDGTAKKFPASTINNLTEFFDRFKALSIGSDAELERLVQDAQNTVHGIQPDWLRGNEDGTRNLRTSIANKITAVQSQLDELMVARPKRAISFDDE